MRVKKGELEAVGSAVWHRKGGRVASSRGSLCLAWSAGAAFGAIRDEVVVEFVVVVVAQSASFGTILDRGPNAEGVGYRVHT